MAKATGKASSTRKTTTKKAASKAPAKKAPAKKATAKKATSKSASAKKPASRKTTASKDAAAKKKAAAAKKKAEAAKKKAAAAKKAEAAKKKAAAAKKKAAAAKAKAAEAKKKAAAAKKAEAAKKKAAAAKKAEAAKKKAEAAEAKKQAAAAKKAEAARKKAEAAEAKKQAAEAKKAEAARKKAEAAEAKKQAAAAKKAEAARKKAEAAEAKKKASEAAMTDKERRYLEADKKRKELAARVADDEAIEVDELLDVAKGIMGIESLRPGQREALEHILNGEDLLAVMPTGAGKSLTYQLPSLVLPGITVVVSPLIALIKDQIDKMKSWGVAVCRIDSTLTVKQKREMEALIKAPGGKLLLTTPERMAVPEFREFLKESAEGVGVSLFVVDEAHCVSQWGHDFRPAYLGLRKAIEDLDDPPILATTATAPPHVRDDICHQLDIPDAKLVTTTFDRPNLHYEVIAVPGDDEKNKTLITLLKKLPKPSIVYCATVKMVNQLHERLYRHGIEVTKYHGRLTKKERDQNQQEFMDRSDLVMVATNAFGLGVDKADIRNVLHYHVPGSLEAYAQEAGRGGRDRKPARCVLFFSPDDVAIQEYFLKGTYPTRKQVRAVYTALKAWREHESTEPSVGNIAIGARSSVARTKTVLSLLKDEGFVLEDEAGLFRVPDPLPDETLLYAKAKQYEARRIADRQRLDALLAYVGTPGCRNQVILSYLGEDEPPECGRCDNCLRSKEAAIAAAREASKLENGVLSALRDEDEDEDELKKLRTQTLVRTRIIRIDKEEPKPEGDESADQDDDLDEDRLEGEEDEYEYYDEEDDEEDEDEVAEIEQTAAALAAEGYTPEEIEITILARKKVAKPPKKRKKQSEEEPEKKKRKRRKRRRKKGVIPKQAAFSSPVLIKPEAAPAPKQTNKAKEGNVKRRRNAPAAPLVEYVRGPMRINMTPVASAGPNDVNRRKKNKPKRRRKKTPTTPDINAGSVISVAPASVTSVPADGGDAPPTKKKRRRRRRRKKKSQGEQKPGSDMPIDFFSTKPNTAAPTGIPGTAKKKKRRRRRRRGSGKNRQAARAAEGGGNAPQN